MPGQERERTGSVYSNVDIFQAIKQGHILVEPFEEDLIKSASLELRLFNEFAVFNTHKYRSIDPRNIPDDLMKIIKVEEGETFILHPGEFALGSTLEVIKLPDNLIAQVNGKSSLGRLGLHVHATAGYVDPGWRGQLTLEFSNTASLPIELYPGMIIAQLSFTELKSTTTMPYGSRKAGSHYQNSMGPVPSRYGQDPARFFQAK
jgi:dCTP deaminase